MSHVAIAPYVRSSVAEGLVAYGSCSRDIVLGIPPRSWHATSPIITIRLYLGSLKPIKCTNYLASVFRAQLRRHLIPLVCFMSPDNPRSLHSSLGSFPRSPTFIPCSVSRFTQ